MTKDAGGLAPEEIERAAADAMHSAPAVVVTGMLVAAQHAAESIRMVDLADTMRRVALSMEEAGKAAQRAARKILQAFDAYRDPDVALLMRRRAHGGMPDDAVRWPAEWITYWCAGMLHRSCESDRHNLGCTCSCHRKDKR